MWGGFGCTRERGARTATATATASATATSEGRPRGGRLMFFSSTRKNQQRLGDAFFSPESVPIELHRETPD